MKVGDMVMRKYGGWNAAKTQHHAGIIIKIFEKRCWRSQELGNKVNWDAIDPEPHAEILINDDVLNIPLTDLEPV